MNLLRAYWSFLTKIRYGEDLKGKPDEDTILEKRLEKYGDLCQLGIANLFWKGTTQVFKDMKDKGDPHLFSHIVAFTICLLLMIMGTVAAMFLETSPFPCFVAGSGAMMAIVSMFGSYHLDLLSYFPSAHDCCISMVLTSATFTIHWAYAVQDPWAIHWLARTISALWDLIGRMWNEGGIFHGLISNSSIVILRNQMNLLRAYWSFLTKTRYREDLKGKPDEDTILEKRLEKYGNLCQLGIANLFWKGTTLVFKDMKDKGNPHLFSHIVAFTICLLLMIMGTVAAMFLETSPFPCFMAGSGALMAIVSMFGSYHLDLLPYFPSAHDCCISMVLTSATFTIYWAYAVQDPWAIHLLARTISALWDLIGRMWNEGGIFHGLISNSYIVILRNQMNLRAFWSFLSKTKYGEDLEGKPDQDAILEKRLDRCGNLCQLGIANLFWKGTTLVFKDMKSKEIPGLLYNIELFTVCLVFMIMGTVATMFPETAPFPCFMAGTGALMAIMSMLGSYHLDLLAYFPSTHDCRISMILTSATFTIYWAYAVQDPWIIHLLARLVSALRDLIVWVSTKGWKGKKPDPAATALLENI